MTKRRLEFRGVTKRFASRKGETVTATDKARTRARGRGQRQQGQGRAGEGKGKIKEWLTFDDMEDDDDTMMRGGLKGAFF
jgi:hypothetical protein